METNPHNPMVLKEKRDIGLRGQTRIQWVMETNLNLDAVGD